MGASGNLARHQRIAPAIVRPLPTRCRRREEAAAAQERGDGSLTASPAPPRGRVVGHLGEAREGALRKLAGSHSVRVRSVGPGVSGVQGTNIGVSFEKLRPNDGDKIDRQGSTAQCCNFGALWNHHSKFGVIFSKPANHHDC